MVEEWPETLPDRDAYAEWIAVLAANAETAAEGQAADAAVSGDLADTAAARLEYEAELEVDDKIDVLSDTQTPFDVLRYTDQTPDQFLLNRLSGDDQINDTALNLAHNALVKDVLAHVSP